MGRIANEELEQLKKETPIEAVVARHGVELVRHGADLIGHCPFHDDRTPSFVVSPKKNLWHCLGACQAGGSVIDFVMKAERVDFRGAVEKLRTFRVGVRAKTKAMAHRSPLTLDAGDRELLGEIVDYYHRSLKDTPEALAYLETRGIGSAEMIDQFKIGYSNQTLQSLIPSKDSKVGFELKTRMAKLGLIQKNGREHFMSSIIVPIFDEAGTVSEIYGRRIVLPLSSETPVHRYLPGPHRGVFNREALEASRDIILCEALIDALTFWCAGFRNVTSSYGVEGFTKEIFEAMKRFSTERVFIAYDRDEAGDRAAESLAKRLTMEGMACFRVEFPKGMDANEYARKLKPAPRSLGLALRKARLMSMGVSEALQTNPYASLDLVTLELGAEKKNDAASPTCASIAGDDAPAAEAVVELKSAVTQSTPKPSPLAAEELSEPVTPAVHVTAEVRAEEVVMRFGDRRYRVRGLAKNLSVDLLKVNLLVAKGEHYFVDTIDLYSAKHRALYVKQAAVELGVEDEILKKDLGKVLLKLEELQEVEIKNALEPKEKTKTLTPEEQEAALDLLRDPKLLDRILFDFERCGVVGEETNKLVGYLAAVSRKLEDPLAIIIQSSSAAGKSSLMEAVLAFIPDEDRVKYSAMTGQSLFYMGESNLRHKILAIVEEEGAERASYALKLLQSEKELTIASTGKDPTTGKLVTYEYKVEGPVMIFLTTTAIEIDEELLNRCIVLTVDEDRAQTQAIHRLQRRKETLTGLLERRERARLLKLHQDAQRLLLPVFVTNPFAEELTFLDHRTRTRRDHMKYLVLIRAIAILFQYQRELKRFDRNGEIIEYIEATLEDIALANRLAHQVLGRTLDELPPQTKRLLFLVDAMVKDACTKQGIDRADYRFTRRNVRERTGWGDTQLKIHLHRLEELEYVVSRGGRGLRSEYELVYDGKGDDGVPFLSGLIDPDRLKSIDRPIQTARWSGSFDGWSGVGRPRVGGVSGGGRSDDLEKNPNPLPPLAADLRLSVENALLVTKKNGAPIGPGIGDR